MVRNAGILLPFAASAAFLSAPALGDLAFTEIMYNPASTEPNWEWIEIHNRGHAAIDLSGYVFDDDQAGILASANIAGVSRPVFVL